MIFQYRMIPLRQEINVKTFLSSQNLEKLFAGAKFLRKNFLLSNQEMAIFEKTVKIHDQEKLGVESQIHINPKFSIF